VNSEMLDLQVLAEGMFRTAAGVLGRLVELPAAAGSPERRDHAGSIRTDGEELVALAEIPALGAQIVVRFLSADMQRIVALMLGGGEAEGFEMGPMQLSIASETVSQIAAAMAEQLARDLDVSTDGIHASLCTDIAAIPPPPFESYEATIELGDQVQPRIAVDFAAITRSKMESALRAAMGSAAETAESAGAAGEPVSPTAEAPAAAAPRRTEPPTDVQAAAFTPLQPTSVRTAPPGQANLDLVHDVPLQVSAVLGKTVMPLREVVALQSGSVFELDKESTEPVDLYVNNILIARGEVVIVDDKYAVKISELNPQAG